MTMKRFCATALLLLWSLCALAVQKSGTIVYINGSKFYVHTVQPGETLYAIARQVSPSGATTEQTLVALWRANPNAFIEGDINRLKVGGNFFTAFFV